MSILSPIRRGYLSPGARKEKILQRAFKRPNRPARHDYAELHSASAFSFLDGASLPEDLVERAVALGLPAVALVDTNGVYGAPRFYKAAREAGIKALVGAEVVVEGLGPGGSRRPSSRPAAEPANRRGPLGIVPRPRKTSTPDPEAAPRLTLLVANRAGYRSLCRLLTAAAVVAVVLVEPQRVDREVALQVGLLVDG